MIKAARSAEHIPPEQVARADSTKSNATIIRKESSSSLQIPGMLRRSNSESNKTKSFDSIKEDNSKKVVTFSQVVDQMACSFSDSSSLSDLSSCTEDFKHSVSAHVPRRTNRKLMRSNRVNKRARQAAAGGYFGHSPRGGGVGNGTSGSEADVNCESSMESIESTNANLTLHPLSALNKDPAHSKKLQKISSSDSLMSMIKSLAVNRKSASTPSSPQLSQDGDAASISSGFPTPLTTPDTPCGKTAIFSPRGQTAKDHHAIQKHRRISGDSTSSSPSMSPTRASSQIMVEVLDPLNPKQPGETRTVSSSGQASTGEGPASNTPTITLEVPNFNFGKCLSPIKELPSPIPTPIPSPLPHSRGRLGSIQSGQHHGAQAGLDEISTSSSSSSGKSTSTSSVASAKSKAVKALSARRSSFTAFCKKAAGAGKHRRTSLAKISLSRSDDIDDDNCIPMKELVKKDESGCDYNEISIAVPTFAVPPRPTIKSVISRPIPMITLTEPDSDMDFDDEDEELINVMNNCMDGDVPSIAVSPPSPRPGRHEMITAFNLPSDTSGDDSFESDEPVRPVISVIVSPVKAKKASTEIKKNSSNGSCKARPPPLTIVNSNYGSEGSDETGQQSLKQDTLSKPEPTSVQAPSGKTAVATIVSASGVTSLASSSIGVPRPIELREGRSISPNVENMNNSNLVRSAKLVKQNNILEGRNALLKQSENVTEEVIQVTIKKDNGGGGGNKIEDMDFLSPPGTKFDSTPRSRSQSVEIPEYQMLSALQKNNPAERKLSLTKPTIQIPPAPMMAINVMVQPPTPTASNNTSSLAAWESERDEGLVALMQKRSQQGQIKTAEIKAAAASWTGIRLGSPPAQRSELTLRPPDTTDKPRPLDLPNIGPAIMVTPMSEIESDDQTEPIAVHHIPIPVTSTKTMHYLSPFTIITTSCTSRTTSESNLSSSGYSSMASPGPSRSGSSNPLCISESEDTSTPTKTTTTFFPKLSVTPPTLLGVNNSSGVGGAAVVIRRPNNLLKSPSVDSESSDPVNANYKKIFTSAHKAPLMAARYRTDSETTDEQCIPEDEVDDDVLDVGAEAEVVEGKTCKEEKLQTQDGDDNLDCSEEDVSPNCDVVPQITLEVQSSTESDKTVLSTTTVRDALSAILPSTSANSLASSEASSSAFKLGNNKQNKLSLTLPEIIVQPCTPAPSSPSAESSPTAVRPASLSSSSTPSSSSLSIGGETLSMTVITVQQLILPLHKKPSSI